jgi:hypothetical protein
MPWKANHSGIWRYGASIIVAERLSAEIAPRAAVNHRAYRDVAERTGWSPRYAAGVLHGWKLRGAYCDAVLRHEHRWNLNGEEVAHAVVEAAAREQAREQLARIAARRAKRRAKEQRNPDTLGSKTREKHVR